MTMIRKLKIYEGKKRNKENYKYDAEACFNCGAGYVYRVGDIWIKITASEFTEITSDPFLYESSLALRLHNEILKRKKEIEKS